MSTIRSSNVHNTLKQEFDTHQNLHISAYYQNCLLSQALNFWSEFTRNMYTGLLIYSFFLFKSFVGDVGLSITLSMQSSTIQQAVKSLYELQEDVIAIDRVMDYTDIEAEECTDSKFDKYWPRSGNLRLKSVSMRYSPQSDLVLNEISFAAGSGEKIGILGCNASGKASLISAIFRLFNFEGSVVIDNFDSKDVPLVVLRSKICVVPNQPLVLPGTLRQNLDPFGEFSDYEVWSVLRDVDLGEFFSKLYSDVGEVGLSLKEKRVLCLVRGFLKGMKILILEQGVFDRNIKRLVRKKFKECTVLIVALTRESVIDCDKILVLNNGSVMCFSTPDKTENFD